LHSRPDWQDVRPFQFWPPPRLRGDGQQVVSEEVRERLTLSVDGLLSDNVGREEGEGKGKSCQHV